MTDDGGGRLSLHLCSIEAQKTPDAGDVIAEKRQQNDVKVSLFKSTSDDVDDVTTTAEGNRKCIWRQNEEDEDQSRRQKQISPNGTSKAPISFIRKGGAEGGVNGVATT